ncbi:hypothetical protein GCM10009676_38660 [Prauserella halophila]|uniref:Uncharacterized protein n=1 Tax=Prauserella halophila TaxID=185641 RepID=A0ABP4H2Y4_9PSEU
MSRDGHSLIRHSRAERLRHTFRHAMRVGSPPRTAAVAVRDVVVYNTDGGLADMSALLDARLAAGSAVSDAALGPDPIRGRTFLGIEGHGALRGRPGPLRTFKHGS